MVFDLILDHISKAIVKKTKDSLPMETQEAMNLNLSQQQQQPVVADQLDADSVTGLEIILDEEELGSNPQGHIEERIRQLEAVTARLRQRQRWRRQAPVSPIQNDVTGASSSSVLIAEALTVDSLDTIEPHIPTMNTARERESDNKTDSSSLLVAEALALDSLNTTPKRVEPRVGSFYDCNICFDIATDPVLTCCGHLFCWPCYYQLSYADSFSKECPECQGEVNDASITPVYGHGDGNTSRKRNASVSAAPPRPRAARIEGVRQQFLRRGLSSMNGHRIQQLRNIVGANGERSQLTQGLFGSQINAMDEITSILPSRYTSPATEMSSNQRHDSLQVSGLLIQRAASASSISSALNTAMDSAERLLEDLEAYSNLPRRRRNRQQSPSDDNGVTSYISTIIPPENVASHNTAVENNPDVLPGASFVRTFPAMSGSEDQTLNPEINSILGPSSSRRRSNRQRESDVNSNMHSSETRRRRLR